MNTNGVCLRVNQVIRLEIRSMKNNTFLLCPVESVHSEYHCYTTQLPALFKCRLSSYLNNPRLHVLLIADFCPQNHSKARGKPIRVSKNNLLFLTDLSTRLSKRIALVNGRLIMTCRECSSEKFNLYFVKKLTSMYFRLKKKTNKRIQWGAVLRVDICQEMFIQTFLPIE